jgi:hypothetical protein
VTFSQAVVFNLGSFDEVYHVEAAFVADALGKNAEDLRLDCAFKRVGI